MSVSGLTDNNDPPTLDGLTILDADAIYINGQEVNLDALVPYTGATQAVDLGIYPLRTTHLAAAGSDVVNKDRLDLSINNVVASIGSNFLSKTTTDNQTVAGAVSFSKGATTADQVPAALGSQVVVGPNYPISTVSSATVTVSQFFGSITNANGVYQATTDIAAGVPILIGFPITNGKKYRFTVEFLVEDPTYTWYIDAYQSVDNINPVTFGVLGFTLIPANTSVYTTIDYTFDAVTTGYVIFPVTNDASPTISNKAVKWKGLVVFEQGVALQNVTMPAQTASKVPIFDAQKRLVSSGVDAVKITYLDNVSSDIQTQLNSKLANTSGQAFGTFDFTSSVPILFSGFSGSHALVTNGSKQLAESAVTSTELGYVSGVTSGIQTQLNAKADTTALANYLPLAGGTMTGLLQIVGSQPISLPGLTSSRVLATNDGGYVATTAMTFNDASYLTGITSNVQTQLNNKLNLSGGQLSGNLGIGTSPASTLHLYDTADPLITFQLNPVDYSYISAYADLFLGANVMSGGGGIKNFNRGTASIRLVPEAYDGGYMTFSTSDEVNEAPTERMRIDKNGKVGIGTDTPSCMLDVIETVQTGAFTDPTFQVRGSTSFDGSNIINFQTQASEYGRNILYMTGRYEGGNDAWAFGTPRNAITFRTQSSQNSAYTNRWSIQNYASDLGFLSAGGGNTPRVVFRDNGNVGIGASPGSLLDIYSTGYSYDTSLRVRTEWAGIQLASSGSGGRTWNMLSSISSAGIGAGRLGIYDETASRYCMWWKENGAVCINNSTSVLVGNDYMAAGSLSIGNMTQNYGGGSNWNSNTAGLLMECADNTEIAIHDSGTRVASFMYYNGGANVFIMGRDMGWGTTQVLIPNQLVVGTKISVGNSSDGKLNIQNPNGSYTHFGWPNNNNYIRGNTIFDTGYVEIGGSYVWRAPLDITTSVSRDNGCVRYFDVWGGLGYTCNWYSYSAMADTWGGARFMAYSDIRKKKDVQPVVNALETIDDIRVVSYNHIDIAQPHNYWGVIAQEIEEKYPYLISQGKEFLPNIYQEATAHNCTSCGEFVWLEMTTEQDTAHMGKPIRLFTYDEEGKQEYEETTEVVEVRGKRIKVKKWKKHDEERYVATERVFVYGTCEEDVRTVDKTQFGLLAVAGCQELKHETETQKGMIEALSSRLAVLEAREAVWVADARAKEKEFADYKAKTDERLNKIAMLLHQLAGGKSKATV